MRARRGLTTPLVPLCVLTPRVLLAWAFCAFCVLVNACSPPAVTVADALERRVDSVLALMTLEEKAGQLTLYVCDGTPTKPTLRKEYAEGIKAGRVGALFNPVGAAFTRELQELAVKHSRLKIPLLFGHDIIHGFKTIFPIPLGSAASWDTALIRRSERVAATEAAAAGLHWTFAPMVDIARDPRWGRIAEGAGEDTHLGSAIARARVLGLQGDTLAANDALLACVKHFAGYGAAEGGRDYNTAEISDRTLREVYLPPFKAALDAGALSLMTGLHELNGVPCTADTYLLTDILRKEWSFKGFVVTDYTSINEMLNHGVGGSIEAVGGLAMNAGADMDMQGGVFQKQLPTLVKKGIVSEERLNEAVRRVLRLKFLLGLFDNPFRHADSVRQQTRILTQAHLQTALELAQSSIVLLKNEKFKNEKFKNEQNTSPILPIPSTMKTIAVVGPLAASKRELLGSWSAVGDSMQCVSLLDGIRSVFPRATVLHAEGCGVEDSSATQGSTTRFADAVSIASRADVIIAALGEEALMSGEAASRSTLGLPGNQEQLLKQLHATGKPVALVLMSGRPLAIPWAAEHIPAILETWFLGTQAGKAIADVLAGRVNPSGKLPVTFPRSVGQIPLYYNHKPTGRPAFAKEKYTSKYLDVSHKPLYAFGHGLSYSAFSYANLRVERSTVQWTKGARESVRVWVDVGNTGTRDGVETVQMYVRDNVASITRPVKELRGFQRISLTAGSTKKVEFRLAPDDLAFYTEASLAQARQERTPKPVLKRVVEAGDCTIMVGGSSDKLITTRLTVR